MEYGFTIEDLRAYLAAKREDEVVGYCASASTCLVAWAVQAKYACQIGMGGVSVDGFDVELTPVGVCLPLSPVLEAVTAAFDSWTEKEGHEPVTKAEFLRGWRAYLAYLAEMGEEATAQALQTVFEENGKP